ncbi:NACHT and WD repeat domain-containing protein 2-like isoform X2 [Mytilus trossulus]|uniref:NACHT and WD repeat domain-containing protein 2-like isoform X2 n=1 Tax=Mytilus trossulus TaxID=6551 RepID=UPI003006404B
MGCAASVNPSPREETANHKSERDPQKNGTPVMPTPHKLSKSASVFTSQQENTTQKLSTNSCKKNQLPTSKKVDESDKTGKKEESVELRKPSYNLDKKNQSSTAKKVDESFKKGQKGESEELRKLSKNADEKNQPQTAKKKDESVKKGQKEESEKIKKQANDMMVIPQDTNSNLQNTVTNDAVYQGYLDREFISTDRIIRIFTSSTFTDTKHERNRMMETTFPRLREYCKQRGFEFQIVDMRWGIRDEATNDHMTTEICLQELANCQKYSAGPNFLSLLSHKYGKRSLPRQIPADKYEKIIKCIELSDQRQLLSKWYVKDDNCVPPLYILQPISSHLPEFIVKQNKEKQNAAKEQWWKESDMMFDSLVTGAEKALTQEEAYTFKISVTHIEVMRGLADQELGKKCIWLKRNITDIEKQEPSKELSRFTECNGPVEKVKTLLEDLKGDLSRKLPSENILSYNITWREKGLNPDFKEHSDYLDKITDDAEKKLKQLINDMIRAEKKNKQDNLRLEVKQHLLFCQSKCADFKGKEDTLKAVHNYIKSDKRHPLVIHGESGSGKTSLMAMIAKKTNEWLDGKATVVIRFLGTTPKSSNLFDLLCSVAEHISVAKNMERLNPKSMEDALSMLQQILTGTTASDHNIAERTHSEQDITGTTKPAQINITSPLVLILDSLDQLDPSYNARVMRWLPPLIGNPHVKVIVSTLEDQKYEVFPNLKRKIPAEGFIPVSNIPKADVKLILKHWLKRKQRRLTHEQEDLLYKSYDQCPVPLYLNLCFLKASQWTSYMNFSSIQLYQTVREAINGLFEKLENLHGYNFVSKTLGCITAAKLGLTETELEDILACDDDVLNDVYEYWTPPIRRLPPLLLVRLRHDLQQYLVDRGADGATVIYWYHRQFIEAAQDRYCREETCENLHTALADYFLGTWANGNKKPYLNRSNESGLADRYVVAQPIKYGDTYNLRKLNNLPYHLTMSKRVTQLKDECLMNLTFINTKLECSSVRSVIEDYEIAKKMINDQQLNLILQALLVSGESILHDESQFSQQMFLRLKDNKELQTFTDACLQRDVTYMCPDSDVLVKVGGPLVYTSGEHELTIPGEQWVDIKKNGKIAVTAAYHDHSLGLWDVKNCRLVRILENIVDYPLFVYFVADDSLILIYSDVSDESHYLSAVTELGEKKYSISTDDWLGYCICGSSKDILVGLMASNVVNLYDTRTGIIIEELFNQDCNFPENAFPSGSDNYAICTDYERTSILVVDLEKKNVYSSSTIKFPSSKYGSNDATIDYAAVTNDGKYVIASNTDDKVLYMYEMKTFKFVRKFEDYYKEQPNFCDQFYKFSMDGKKLYTFTDKSILVIDLETGSSQQHNLPHNGAIRCCVSNDMTTFITVSSDTFLRIWNISKATFSEENQLDIGKSTEYFTLLPNERYALTCPMTESYEDRIMVVDTVEKKIVSQAVLETEESLKRVIIVSESKAVMCFTKDNNKNNIPLDLHLIDLISMTENPVQGQMFKDCYNILKVNHRKEIMVSTGKNVTFYNTETLKATYAIELPDSDISAAEYKSNIDGTMVAMFVSVPEDNETIIVVDVEARTVVKVLVEELRLKFGSDIDFLVSPQLVPNNKSFIVFLGRKDSLLNYFMYDIKEEKLLHELTDFNIRENCRPLNCILIDDDIFMAVYEDKLMRVWSTKDGSLLKRVAGHNPRFYGFALDYISIHYTPQSPFILTFESDMTTTLHLWDKNSFLQLSSLTLDKKIVGIKLNSDGLSFVTYSEDPIVIVRWTIEGANVRKSTLPRYPAIFKVNDSEQIPTLKFSHQKEKPEW